MSSPADNKTKPISKSKGAHKHHRPTFNNDNANNKLNLNKFHQIKDNKPKFHVKPSTVMTVSASETMAGKSNPGSGKQQSTNNRYQQPGNGANLSKRKRDLQRMIKHCQKNGIDVDIKKKEELATVERDMALKRKKYENSKRKEFFLERKYNNIKQIQTRKVYKHLEALKGKTDAQSVAQSEEWQKKLRYIKHFPKTLKYISLFPTNKPLQAKAIQFQNKIMNDIEEENQKRVQKMNFYKSENEPSAKDKKKKTVGDAGILPTTVEKAVGGKKGMRKVVDDFFMVDQEKQKEVEEESEEEEQMMEQQQQDSQEDERESLQASEQDAEDDEDENDEDDEESE